MATTITPPSAARNNTAPSGAAMIADAVVDTARPALRALVANAEAVMERIENPPPRGNSDAGIPANLGAVPIDQRARYADALAGPGLVSARELLRRDLRSAADRGQMELDRWIADEREAAERDAHGTARPVAETEEAIRLSAMAPGVLMADGRRALRSGDPDAAAVRVMAARLAGHGHILADLAAAVEEALDATRPERIAARERVAAAQREHVAARGRVARLARIADVLGRPPELGPAQRDPGVLVLTWDGALDAARAILATP